MNGGSCNNSSLNASSGGDAIAEFASGIPEGEELSMPSITQEPNSVEACLGDDISFSAQVEGSNLNYQWQVDMGSGFQDVNDGILFSGSQSTNLSVFDISSTYLTYSFRLLIMSDCVPTIQTTDVFINGNDAPMITLQPEMVSTCQGQNVSFSMMALGTDLTYQWQKLEAGVWLDLNNNTIYNGVEMPTLSITQTTWI